MRQFGNLEEEKQQNINDFLNEYKSRDHNMGGNIYGIQCI